MPDGRYWFPANDARLRSDVGTLVRSRYRSDGRAGVLVAGTGQRFMAGPYRLRIEGRWLAPRGQVVLEITAPGLEEPMLRRALEAADAPRDTLLAEVDFVVPEEVPDLQLQLRVDEEARVEFAGFEVDDIGGGFALHAYHAHASAVDAAASSQAPQASAPQEAPPNMEKVG
jgi:hypothetical protein